MLTFYRKKIRVVLFVSAIVLSLATPHRSFGQQAATPSRDQIGEVLGKPVYRDEIHTSRDTRIQEELYRLFLHPLTQHYLEAHKAEVEPTDAEIESVVAFFRKNGDDAYGDKPTKADFRLQLKEIEAQLANEKLSERKRYHFELKKRWVEHQLEELLAPPEKEITWIESLLFGVDDRDSLIAKIENVSTRWMIDEELANPNLTKEKREELEDMKKMFEFFIDSDRSFAVFSLSQWKLERHLYDNYGGGRVLWQQVGYEAFDANRRWLESEESKGNLNFTDPKLRDKFFRYWKQSHSDMIEDEAAIRHYFLEPKWAPRTTK